MFLVYLRHLTIYNKRKIEFFWSFGKGSKGKVENFILVGSNYRGKERILKHVQASVSSHMLFFLVFVEEKVAVAIIELTPVPGDKDA